MCLVTPRGVPRRQIVLQAIERRHPCRLPLLLFNRDVCSSDILGVGAAPAVDFVLSRPGETEWGYCWQTLDDTMGQPDARPLVNPGAFDAYRPPDPYAPGRLAPVFETLLAGGDQFIKFNLGISGFNQASFLRGYEALLMDLALSPELTARVLDIVWNFENGLIEQLAPLPADAVAFADDWGTQQGLMISPTQWRAIFRPRYAEQFALIHQQGKKVWFHSCGNIWDIIGDLIDIGVDVLELLQPDVFGLERLGAEFGGHVCFCCAVDHQRVALSGTREDIFTYTRRLQHALGRFNGGLIGYLEDYASLGMHEETFQWIREAFGTLENPAV